MSETNHVARLAIHRAALNLVTEAQRCGVVVTIETTPHEPLAMGNHDMSVSVRDARRPPPLAGEYGAGIGTQLLCIVRTAQAQATALIDEAADPAANRNARHDLPDTLSVIAHSVQHGLASLTGSGSVGYATELQALRKKVATYEARDALKLIPQHPPTTITSSLMRDDGGDTPAFCLMAAYRTEADARAAADRLGLSLAAMQGGA